PRHHQGNHRHCSGAKLIRKVRWQLARSISKHPLIFISILPLLCDGWHPVFTLSQSKQKVTCEEATMSSKFLLLTAFILSIGLCAQQPMTPTQGGAPVTQPAANIVVPGTNIYVVGGGLYGTGVYVVPQAGPAVTPGSAGVAIGSNAGISLMGAAGISMNTPI